MEDALATGVKAGATWVAGAAVGRFTLLAKLATGGMAEIWLARQGGLKGFEKVVVVKRILESLSADPAFVEMFLDEARIAAQLNHPNIVQVHDLGEFAGAYYLAMEYLPGEHVAALSRAALAAGKPLSFAMSVKLIVAALDGLLHAHTRVGVNGKPLDVVHRDVSPQNIIVTYDGQVKLVDFGIAKAANRSVQTIGGQLKGKFAYMAPEQAQGGRTIDGRADLFSAGVVLFELVSHSRMWTFDDQVQQLSSLIGPEPIRDVRERNPQVPEALSKVIMRALEKDPAQRWPDARSFKDALERWLQTEGGGPTTTALTETMTALFADRMALRTQLIERASRGDMTLDEAGEVLKPPTDRSMPGGTPIGLPEGNSKLLIGAGAALVAVALVIGGLVVMRNVMAEPPSAVEIPFTPPVAIAKLPPSAPSPAQLIVQSEPPAATLTLDGQPAGVAPATLSPIEPGEHLLEANLPGFLPQRRTVTVSAAGEKLRLVLTLEPNPVARVGKETAATPAPAAKGRLTLSTDPWTHVYEGNRLLGDTPLVDLALPAGRHTLRLVSDEPKLNLNIEVEVKSGQLTKKVLKL